jgi:glycosyltransferase involved in cell wall biosynthesis
MITPPTVSVLIPTYNYGRFLDEALQSVINQTYNDYEVIIVDNNSTDNTEQIVKKYLGDPRFSYFKNEKNLGLVGNFNQCLSYAKGHYIKFLNADDKFHPELLEKFVKIMNEHPNVTLVTCDKQAFEESTKLYALPFLNLQKGEKIILDTLNDYNWLGEPTSVMFRKSDIKSPYDAKYKMYSDFDLWLRLLAIGDCYIIPEALAYVRFHSGQLTNNLRRNKFIPCFEEYQLCLTMKELNLLNKFTSEENIEKVTRKVAIHCSKEGIKLIPTLYKKQNRLLFIQAMKIALAEGVLSKAFIEIFKRINKKSLGLRPPHKLSILSLN